VSYASKTVSTGLSRTWLAVTKPIEQDHEELDARGLRVLCQILLCDPVNQRVPVGAVAILPLSPRQLPELGALRLGCRGFERIDLLIELDRPIPLGRFDNERQRSRDSRPVGFIVSHRAEDTANCGPDWQDLV